MKASPSGKDDKSASARVRKARRQLRKEIVARWVHAGDVRILCPAGYAERLKKYLEQQSNPTWIVRAMPGRNALNELISTVPVTLKLTNEAVDEFVASLPDKELHIV